MREWQKFRVEGDEGMVENKPGRSYGIGEIKSGRWWGNGGK